MFGHNIILFFGKNPIQLGRTETCLHIFRPHKTLVDQYTSTCEEHQKLNHTESIFTESILDWEAQHSCYLNIICRSIEFISVPRMWWLFSTMERSKHLSSKRKDCQTPVRASVSPAGGPENS